MSGVKYDCDALHSHPPELESVAAAHAIPFPHLQVVSSSQSFLRHPLAFVQHVQIYCSPARSLSRSLMCWSSSSRCLRWAASFSFNFRRLCSHPNVSQAGSFRDWSIMSFPRFKTRMGDVADLSISFSRMNLVSLACSRLVHESLEETHVSMIPYVLAWCWM